MASTSKKEDGMTAEAKKQQKEDETIAPPKEEEKKKEEWNNWIAKRMVTWTFAVMAPIFWIAIAIGYYGEVPQYVNYAVMFILSGYMLLGSALFLYWWMWCKKSTWTGLD